MVHVVRLVQEIRGDPRREAELIEEVGTGHRLQCRSVDDLSVSGRPRVRIDDRQKIRVQMVVVGFLV